MRDMQTNIDILDALVHAVCDIYPVDDEEYIEPETMIEYGRDPRVKLDGIHYRIDVWINSDTNCIHIADIKKYSINKSGLLQSITHNLLRVCERYGFVGVTAHAVRGVRYNGYYSFIAAGYDGDLISNDLITIETQSGVCEPTFNKVSDFVNKYGLDWWKQYGTTVNVLYPVTNYTTNL